MGKPSNKVYQMFLKKFDEINTKTEKKQFVVPYLMSSHPGSTLKDAVKLAEYLNKNHLNPEQVQDFYPTPGSISTCMYYTGIDPRTMNPVYVATDYKEKMMQRALLQYKKPENYSLVLEALKKTNRLDLVGFGPGCLINPIKGEKKNGSTTQRKNSIRKDKRKSESRNRKPKSSGNTPGARRNHSR
jgi:radical SAM superfamily enzyme YgiQ (UPF0313 family)